jgi:hypothetical protein
METPHSIIDPLLEKAEAYGKTTIELYKLKAVEQTSGATSGIASRVIAFAILFFALLMLSTGGAIWLGEVLGKTYYGFLCVGGFYAITFAVVYYLLHDKIKERIADSIIARILS